MDTKIVNGFGIRTRILKEPFGACAVILLLFTILASPAIATKPSYNEDFTTTTYKDTQNTTADWNTSAGELGLFPFAPSQVGAYNTAGLAHDIAVSGDFAFVADGDRGLQVFDITNPASPAFIGSYNTSGFSWGVAVTGDLAFLADGASGLQVFDITNPASPALVGTYNTPDFARGVAVSGNLAFVADTDTGLLVVDVSDPTSPVLVGGRNTPGIARDVTVAGDYAFVADDTDGLQVIDISDPTNPVIAGAYNTAGIAWEVAVAGDLAFVADDDGGGFLVLDISNPASPGLVGALNTPGRAFGVVVAGDLAFVADDASGLHMVDISDPTSPSFAESYDTPGSAIHVDVSGDLAFVADYNGGLRIIDIGDRVSPPVLAGTFNTPSYAYGLTVSGDLAFVADGNSGLQVIDVSDPSNPVLAGTYNTPSHAWNVVVEGDLAFVADANSGLQLIDVSDPTNPVYVGSYDSGNEVRDVVVSGDFAFVANMTGGLKVVDITDPTSPTLAGAYDTPDYAYSVTVAGDLAFVANEESGVYIIDISNPNSPTLAGIYDTPNYADHVAVAGDYAYVADDAGGILVLDISDPTIPFLAGSVTAPGGAIRVAVSGNLAFVAGHTAGLQLFDITDPTSPTLVDAYDTSSYVWCVAIAGELAYLADDSNGLHLIHVGQHDLVTADNIGQSIAVDGASDTILRGRLTSTESGSVTWMLSADAGANWQSVTTGGLWTQFTPAGDDLVWQSTHAWLPGVSPTVSELTVEWLNEFGAIRSITDIPDDQGGRVLIRLSRSGYDFADETEHLITDYNVWLRVDDAAAREAIQTEGVTPAGDEIGDGSTLLDWRGGRYLSTPRGGDRSGMPPGVWASVGGFPAIQQDEYGFIAETLSDSMSTGDAWSVYCITAHTANPIEWYASYPDSGYSVDNLAPGIPQNLVFGEPGVLLWDEASEEDFAYHTVYGSESSIFGPDATLIGHTVEPTYEVSGAIFGYYHVTTSDHTYNEGDAATIENESASTPGGEQLPTRIAFRTAQPNPFRSQTLLGFELPAAEDVRLAVYDAAGRQVCVLASGVYQAGIHRFSWDGENEEGQPLAHGVYFARFRAGNFAESQRLVRIQ